ncbi:MAG: hypothetical protein WDA75_02830 [Candidatus Latescibacterota bacterium]|jgi:hypothetical protein
MIKGNRILLGAGLLLCAVPLVGCYTVLSAPFPVGAVAPETGSVTVESATSAQDRLSGSGSATDTDQWEDYYRYPGIPSGVASSGYGYGGYPYYGSGYGSSGYGYGYPGYGYYGLGPAYYGYDPYYRDAVGYYVPAGYELVTAKELDELRAGRNALQGQVTAPTEAELEAQRLEKARQEAEAWQRRLEPQVRSAPVATPTAGSTTTTTSTPSATSKSSAGSSSSSTSSSGAAEKGSAEPRKTRR